MLVLASTSAARRRILESAGAPHRSISPGVDEDVAKASLRAEGLSPRAQADALAELKARAGWARAGAPTLGCDQVLDIDGEALDKAENLPALREQLLRLRGRAHRLHSALVLVENGAPTWREVTTSTLHMREFSEAFLDSYLAEEGKVLLGGVGGYRIEGLGAQLFDRVEGDLFSIQGLPLFGLLHALRQRGLVDA